MAFFLAVLVVFSEHTLLRPTERTIDSASWLKRAEVLAKDATIVRDEFGVPHISASTDAAAVFGGMYARAEDEMSRIEIAYARRIGRNALLDGPVGIAADRFLLMFEVPDLARRACRDAPADVQALAQAAADALNYYMYCHSEFRPRAIERWEPWMFFAAEYAWALHHAQVEAKRIFAEQNPSRPAKPATVPPEPDGSNAWAIAPARTKSARAMLYLNPHIPLDEPYELHLRSQQGLHVSGLVAYGAGLLPFAGFNERLGWTLTVNYPDIADVYELEFDIPDDPLAYRHGDQVRRASPFKANVAVRTKNGIEQREQSFLKTHHGPVVYQASGKSYAIRVAQIENLRALEQWYRMARAQDLKHWREAVSLFGVVFHNFVYADADGNIGYVYNAAFPKRDPSFPWSSTVDGSDPRTDWQGYHSLEELPQVWNPPCGYVQNCNSPPLRTAAEGENPAASRFPSYMIGKDLVDGRLAMSHRILADARSWTLDDLQRAAFDTKVHSLEAARAPLLADFARLCESSPEKAKRLAPAIDLLREWDGRLAIDSVPSTLHGLWVEKLFTPAWSKRRAAGDLTAALNDVLDELERSMGSWQVKWGDINRHQRFDTSAGFVVSDDRDSLPIAGGHGGMGVSFCYLSRGTATKRRYGYHGHSYVAAVEFGDDRPVARSVVPFGASRDVNSPHFNDQASLYAGGKLKRVRFSEADVKAGARRTYHPGK
jgi:acyl-homoserine lactone acylase PvdQ